MPWNNNIEAIDYNNDTNVNDLNDNNLKKTSGAQIASKKIIKKYRNLARKKQYQRPLQNTLDDLADLETIDYNNDTSISDLKRNCYRLKEIFRDTNSC